MAFKVILAIPAQNSETLLSMSLLYTDLGWQRGVPHPKHAVVWYRYYCNELDTVHLQMHICITQPQYETRIRLGFMQMFVASFDHIIVMQILLYL